MNNNRRDALVAYLLVACVLFGSLALRVARAAEMRSGSWTIEKRTDEPGKVEFALIERRQHGMSSHNSEWPVGVFVGLDLGKPGRQDVHFTITRDAGKFDCQGYVQDGEGAGIFHFFPDAKYAEQMGALGFSGIDDDKQYSMAVMDVSLAFAKEMKAQQLNGLDTEKLIAFRIFGVDSKFIGELRSAGLSASESDKLVAFRIHGATPEWMAELKKEGYDHVDLQQLIAFRIHGVSPEFIEKVQSLGYAHPEPAQLVAMRIHGVTPEFISRLKARGMQNLTIDDLVRLKIHGID